MKLPAVALLLFATSVQAQSAAPVPRPPSIPFGPIDRTEPASEQRRLEKGTPEERARALARAAATSHDHDESLALLVFATERARALELRDTDLVVVARGLASRGSSKAARDALFALLVVPPREGFDGLASHQRVAATALARAAEFRDPEPVEAPADPKAPRPVLAPKARPDTLSKLLELAEGPRLEATVTQALRRYPPRQPPPAPTGPAFFRIGAALGDLRWSSAIESALRATDTPEPMRVAALRAAAELGHLRALPRITQLARDPHPAIAIAALEAIALLDPRAGVAAIEAVLARPGVTIAHLELSRFVENPNLLKSIADRLGSATPPGPESLRLLVRLPHGAGTPSLVRLASQNGSMHAAIDALGTMAGPTADDALAALLRDSRPVARHEAAHALLARAVAPDPTSRAARAALRRAHAERIALPALVQAFLAGAPTARARAAQAVHTKAHDEGSRPLTALTECARALRLDAPACAFSFGKALPQSLDEANRERLASLLSIEDPSVRAELLDGLTQGAWPGRGEILAHALVEAADLPLRRRLARLAHRLLEQDPAFRPPLLRALATVRATEPDLLASRLLDGRHELVGRSTHLVRADADGRLRCGYARDEYGTVFPFVLEDGGALVEGVVGTTLEATFTPCDDSVLSPRAMR